MGKLMKYEFRKQLLSKIVVGVLVAALELLYIVGVLAENGDWTGLGAGLLMIVAVASLFYFSFEVIITYSNDLKTKQSYMLFLTPRSMYQIVGAKMLTTVLQILGAGLLFMFLFLGDVFLICAKNGEIKELIEGAKDFFLLLTGVEIRLAEIVYVILMLLVAWLEFILMAMLAITLSTTLFANKKYKGVISVILYFCLQWIVGKIADMVTGTGFLKGTYLVVNTEAWAYICVYVAVMAGCFFGTALLLEKKVSV